MTTEALPKSICSPGSAAGPTPRVGLGGMTARHFGAALAPANLSARQAKAMGLLTSGTYGPPSSTSSVLCDRSESLVSRLRAVTDATGSTLFTVMWMRQNTPSEFSIYQARSLGRRTSDSACTGWPTPTTPSGGQTAPEGTSSTGRTPDGRKVQVTLKDVARLSGWPTPAAHEAGGTPEAFLERKRQAVANGHSMGVSMTSLSLMTQYAGWRPPTALSPNARRGGGQDPAKRLAQGHTVDLKDQVLLARGPLGEPARLLGSGVMLIGSCARTLMGHAGGQLSPGHSRWLQGYPVAFELCHPNYEDWRKWQALMLLHSPAPSPTAPAP